MLQLFLTTKRGSINKTFFTPTKKSRVRVTTNKNEESFIIDPPFKKKIKTYASSFRLMYQTIDLR